MKQVRQRVGGKVCGALGTVNSIIYRESPLLLAYKCLSPTDSLVAPPSLLDLLVGLRLLGVKETGLNALIGHPPRPEQGELCAEITRGAGCYLTGVWRLGPEKRRGWDWIMSARLDRTPSPVGNMVYLVSESPG